MRTNLQNQVKKARLVKKKPIFLKSHGFLHLIILCGLPSSGSPWWSGGHVAWPDQPSSWIHILHMYFIQLTCIRHSLSVICDFVVLSCTCDAYCISPQGVLRTSVTVDIIDAIPLRDLNQMQPFLAFFLLNPCSTNQTGTFLLDTQRAWRWIIKSFWGNICLCRRLHFTDSYLAHLRSEKKHSPLRVLFLCFR